MKSDNNLELILKHIKTLRAYNDNYSIIIRLKIIDELNMQIKNLIIQRL